MRKEDIRYSSWVISLTSILYGIARIAELILKSFLYSSGLSYYYFTYYVLYLMLIFFGITKILGLYTKNKKVRKTSILSLMFVWGFIWTSSFINLIQDGFNPQTVLIIPIIALCIYIAMRGDYS